MPVGQNAKKAEANFFCELPIQMFMVGIVAAWVLAPSYALAREYFVSPVGDDAAEGSSAKPWRTIQRAADVAQPGDVVTIRGNRIHHNGGLAGIWLDWMAQGTRVSGNTLWLNKCDLFFEVDHGPILVEGNTCLSSVAARTCSQSIAYVGNRMWGRFVTFNEQRCTPVFKPHSVTLDSINRVPCGSGGHVFINNILAHDPHFPKELFPSRFEDNWMIPAECWKGNEMTGECEITPPAVSKRPDFKPVDAKRFGKPIFVDQEFPEPMLCKPRL